MTLLDRLLTPATVTDTGTRTGRFHHLTLETPAPLPWTPGQQIRVHVNGLAGPRRTYSVWDRRDRSLELRVLDHENAGPGARWARTAVPGTRVRIGRPEGGLVPRPGDHHLFLGDETASAAFGPMMRALHARGAQVTALIEVADENDRLPLPGDVTWTYREGPPSSPSPTFLRALSAFPLPTTPPVTYLAGEARTLQSLRTHLTHHHAWPRRTILTKPFWTPGKRGLE
ncbi:hypothetical protein GCM10009801_29280 [Streptomyces albiaxialis]|uniref:FAD-binding FR-type domain-containing protein n=1 Tax=Streptomyces albiaxialis TaxID=329523 RepID=A0ABN2VY59_9ACTN